MMSIYNLPPIPVTGDNFDEVEARYAKLKEREDTLRDLMPPEVMEQMQREFTNTPVDIFNKMVKRFIYAVYPSDMVEEVMGIACSA